MEEDKLQILAEKNSIGESGEENDEYHKVSLEGNISIEENFNYELFCCKENLNKKCYSQDHFIQIFSKFEILFFLINLYLLIAHDLKSPTFQKIHTLGFSMKMKIYSIIFVMKVPKLVTPIFIFFLSFCYKRNKPIGEKLKNGLLWVVKIGVVLRCIQFIVWAFNMILDEKRREKLILGLFPKNQILSFFFLIAFIPFALVFNIGQVANLMKYSRYIKNQKS